MFFQRALWFLLLSIIGCFSGLSSAQTLTLPVEDYPPYITVDESSNSISGMDIRVTQAAFAAVGIQVSFETAPWQAILQGIESGEFAGTVSCARRPERAPYMLFSNEVSTSSRVLISRSSFATDHIESIYDLNTFRVISVEQWDMEQQLTELNIEHSTVQGISEGLESIMAGQSDVFFVSRYPVLNQAKKEGLQKSIKVSSLVAEPLVPLHVCLSKNYPQARELVQAFNQGLQVIKSNGTFQAIRNEYL